MDDVRWFAPNRFCTLVVPRLRDRGLSIALDGDSPARLAIAMDAQVAAEAGRYAARQRCPLIHYVWDLPPWWLGRGRHDWVWLVAGRYVWLPRLGRRYAERRGFYSRLRYVAAHAAAVWVPSAATAASVRERFRVDCRQVPFCFDSDRFTPAPTGRRRGLLTVSHLTPHKNQAAVVRAAARLAPKTPVRIIGKGSERASLERPLRQLERLRDEVERLRVSVSRLEIAQVQSRETSFGLALLNAARCRLWNREEGTDRYFMSGEDLTTQAGLAVQQDLALVSLLGLGHVTKHSFPPSGICGCSCPATCLYKWLAAASPGTIAGPCWPPFKAPSRLRRSRLAMGLAIP